MRDLLNNPLNGSHDLAADHLILGTGLGIMPCHFQSGVSGGILDAVLADAELIHSGNAVEAEFMGRMIGDLTIFTVLIGSLIPLCMREMKKWRISFAWSIFVSQGEADLTAWRKACGTGKNSTLICIVNMISFC